MASSKVVSSRASMAASEIVSTVISATDDDVTAATAAAAVASVASVASMSSVSSGATVTAFQMVGKSSVQMFSETAAVAASVAASVTASVSAATVAAASVATAESSTESTTSAVTVVIMVLMNYHFFRRVRFFRYVNSDVNTETKVNILSHMAIIYNSRKAEKLHSTIVYL